MSDLTSTLGALVSGAQTRVATLAKHALAPIIYRNRPVGLSAGKLYLYLDALYRSNGLAGDVVEIGCNVCGTAALGHQMLRKLSSTRKYVCIDTFGGFVESQFERDAALGAKPHKGASFSANNIELARRVLALHGASDTTLIQGDICTLDPERLPAAISVALLDVDLYEPTLAGLRLLWPKLLPGGVILVDDCGDRAGGWAAGTAVTEFEAAAPAGLTSRNEFGMAVLSKRA